MDNKKRGSKLFIVVIVIFLNGYSAEKDNVKRILLTDQNYVDNQNMYNDLQILKKTVEELKQQLSAQSKYMMPATSGAMYIQWGRKTCTKNGTDLVYSGMGGGGYYNDKGRSVKPICLPHDPDLGPVSSASEYASLFGMEYNENTFGSGLVDKDVPCAVCRVNQATTTLMIPGKQNCYSGWNMEYRGLLASGYWSHNGASSYLCIDNSPDVLEGGVRDDNGYLLYPVKAYCGSLKCPPYVQNSLLNCVVCSK